MANTEIKDSGESSIPTSLAVWLPVPNGEKAVAFYKSAFGAKETYRLETPDGGLVARLSIDGPEFWLSGGSTDDKDAYTAPAAENVARMILTVVNPDEVFAKALDAGASEIFPVGEEYGWRLGRLVDPFGYHWEIGHPLDG